MIADILTEDAVYSSQMNPLPDEDFAAYIRRVREERGLTTKEVEDRSGGRISRGYISQLEGRTSINPTPAKLDALADGLSISSAPLYDLVRTKRSSGSDTFRNSNLYILFERSKRCDPETRRFIEQQVEMLITWLNSKEQEARRDPSSKSARP